MPDAPTDPADQGVTLPPGGRYPGSRRTPDTGALVSGYAAAADVILSLLNHVDELDYADVAVTDGRAVRIVSLSEVETWLQSCASRVRAGNVL